MSGKDPDAPPPPNDATVFAPLPQSDPATPAPGEKTSIAPTSVAPTSVAPTSVAPGQFTAPPGPPIFGRGTSGSLVGYFLNDLFEITRFIAAGGMGEVYEGRNLASKEKVAIKVILPQFAADDNFMALFRREASALERLAHDAIVKYRTLAFDRATQLNYLVTEFVDGPPMTTLLEGKPMPAATVRLLLTRLAGGLAAAHEYGVIHRDLSPDNILLAGGELKRAKIIDFGIAKDTNPGEKSVVGSAFAGKFGYAAPEIFGRYGRAVGPWTDVYSLALTVLAVARGEPVDMGTTIVDALEARDSVPDIAFVGDELRPVFEAMLQPDPEKRLRSMPDVLAMLGQPQPRGATAPPVHAAAKPVPLAAEPAAPRSKAPLFAGIGAAVLAVAAGGYFLTAGKPSAPPATPAPTATPAVAGKATPGALEWDEAAQRAVAGALGGVGCSDLRVSGPPEAGVIKVSGWHSSASTLPTSAAGFRLDMSAATAIAQPSAEACQLVDALRGAVRSSPANQIATLAGDFAMPGETVAHYTGKGSGAAFPVDLRFDPGLSAARPSQIVSIDDAPAPGEQRVVAGKIPPGFKLNAADFERKAKRYLVVLIGGGPGIPDAATGTSQGRLADHCAKSRCLLTSSWIDTRP
jgi:serine/threonine-protein kinase